MLFSRTNPEKSMYSMISQNYSNNSIDLSSGFCTKVIEKMGRWKELGFFFTLSRQAACTEHLLLLFLLPFLLTFLLCFHFSIVVITLMWFYSLTHLPSIYKHLPLLVASSSNVINPYPWSTPFPLIPNLLCTPKHPQYSKVCFLSPSHRKKKKKPTRQI